MYYTKERPGPGYPTGRPNAKTQLRQELGIDGKDQMKKLGLYLRGAGALRLIKQMKTLKGYRYVQAWQAVSEYIMPKLQRTFIEDERDQAPTVNDVLQQLPLEDKIKMLEVLRSHHMQQQLTEEIAKV